MRSGLAESDLVLKSQAKAVQRHSWLVTALTTLLLAGCGAERADRDDPDGSGTVQVALVEGSGQSATVARQLPNALVVRATDAAGRPLSGVPVVWTVAAGGGSLAAVSAMTDAAGIARANWLLGPRAGQQSLAVSIGGAQPRVFTALATPGTAAMLEKVSGDSLSGPAGLPLADSLVIRVTDSYGNPVPGTIVKWAAGAAGATLSPAASVADSLGLARTQWKLAPVAGPSTATAMVVAMPPAAFTATATPQEVAGLEKVSGDAQSGPVGAQVSEPLVVRAVDAAGNPVAGVSVAWQVREGGGLIAPAITNTDQQGLARAVWTVGGSPGANTAIAAAAGEIVTFTATGAASPAAAAP